MGELSDAENARLDISREEQDAFAARSHARAAAATRRPLAEEIAPLNGLDRGRGHPTRDDRRAARLPSLLPSRAKARSRRATPPSSPTAPPPASSRPPSGPEHAGHEPLAEVVGRAVVAGPDSSLHLRPAEAARKLLDRDGLQPEDVDLWEINEAFAGVAVAVDPRARHRPRARSTPRAAPSRSGTRSPPPASASSSPSPTRCAAPTPRSASRRCAAAAARARPCSCAAPRAGPRAGRRPSSSAAPRPTRRSAPAR